MCPILTCDTALERSLVRLSENTSIIEGLSEGKCNNLEVFYLANVPMPGDWAEQTEISTCSRKAKTSMQIFEWAVLLRNHLIYSISLYFSMFRASEI